MTGFSVAPGDLAAAATSLDSAAEALAVQLPTVDAGPDRLNSAIAAFSADTRDTLSSVRSSLISAVGHLNATVDSYTDSDTATARRFR
ncbi:hypothetical protein [Actinokineospora inagensis]|uniref:hypothetical protein n=1 Tax=Actinokineospora inagensis TaxID=103730 RepID=UPI000421CCF4|nr:hypothetical protein [Actinokineospora inagensis]